MRICFIADARSPIAQNWIEYFVAAGHEVHIISTYPCPADSLGAKSLRVVPVAFSALAGVKNGTAKEGIARSPRLNSLISSFRGGRLTPLVFLLRHWLGPIDVLRHLGQIRRAVRQVQPDLVHAMRIPFEGLSAAQALKNLSVPLVISVWGNDFTLFAERFRLIGLMTRSCMRRASALHTDCRRDLGLAKAWGFNQRRPAVVLPGNGGIETHIFQAGPVDKKLADRLAVPEGVPVIFNPRGIRAYVRNDVFFRSIPLVLQEKPEAIFLAVGMKGNPLAENRVRKLNISGAVRLIPSVSRSQMADLYRLASITVSPSEHDGTPNTLLEGMASGAFPVAGDIESVAEWIEHGVNGLLCDPTSPESLARALLHALGDEKLRRRAAKHNQKLVAERADYARVMVQAEKFYRQVREFSSKSTQTA